MIDKGSWDLLKNAPESRQSGGGLTVQTDACQRRYLEVRQMLRNGTYWIAAEELAPILVKIFLSMKTSGGYRSNFD